MRWKIGECEYDSNTREISFGSAPLGELDAKLLDTLIERYGIKYEHGSKYENDQLVTAVWGHGGTDRSLQTSVKKVRDAFGDERRSYILARPFRLREKPERIADELGSERGIEFNDPDLSDSRQSKESSPPLRPEFELVVDGIIINSVSELIYDDPGTRAIRKACSASYARSLADLAFAIVYAIRLVTAKDFRPSLTMPDQPGQELAARLGEICEQRAYPNHITDGHLLRDEGTRDGIRADVRRFSQCMADRRNTDYFRDFMLREGTKHLGKDDRVFQEDISPGDYKFDLERPFYTNRQIQDELGSATDVLMSFLPKTPPNSTDRYATNALREFVTQDVLTHITIMWEGEEYARESGARRAPHILRSLVTMRRSKDWAATQHQEIVRDFVVEHALTAALRSRQKENRHNIVGVLLNLRDDYPFKQFRALLNEHHMSLMEPDPKKEKAAQMVLRQLKALAASTSMGSDPVRLARDTVIRAPSGTSGGEYRYELYRVFPELDPARG